MTGPGVALLAVTVMLIAAAAAVFWPLRSGRREVRNRGNDESLELARDSKLGEIHDLELDFRLGKLCQEDYQALNATLRSEAVEIIRRIDSPADSGDSSMPGSKRR